MEQDDIVKALINTVGSFIQDRLIDKDQRTQQKEQCAERLSAEGGTPDKGREVRYSDQAILANLDWGIDALEEAINTSNMETKMARLDYAEKMLQVCAMLNSSQKTAGVPNFYLSAWAHLNLSCLWMLRNNRRNVALHVLEMFIVDPFFSRIDFAPELWKSIFLSHMSSIVGWYSEERRRILMDVIPDSTDLSFTVDFDQYFNESLILSVRPEQAERIQQLEQLYGQYLDENTRLYAKYYKDCLTYDSANSRKLIPMLPIVEPPMTPLHEVSGHSIPDYVKFGPILPKSAGFFPVLKSKEDSRDVSRSKEKLIAENIEDSADWGAQEEVLDECEASGQNLNSLKDRACEIVSNEVKVETDNGNTLVVSNASINEKNEITSIRQGVQVMDGRHSSQYSSRIFSPKTPSPRTSSPHTAMDNRKTQSSVLRLLSSRAMDSSMSNSLPISPLSCCDNSSISSTDSEGELAVQLKLARQNVHSVQSVRQLFLERFDKSLFCSLLYIKINQERLRRTCRNNDDGSLSYMCSPASESFTPQSRPPKDFICAITGQLFNDPVTLETGQTYERKAIQEWMSRGNTTCPITRQPLSAASLPKTNYVLKRLISSWKDQHPDLAQEFSSSDTPQTCLSNTSLNHTLPESVLTGTSYLSTERNTSNNADYKPQRFMRAALSTSPTSIISQASVETLINKLKPYILCLCDSEDLKECEAAILTMAKLWEDSNVESGIYSYLSSPTIVNGFMEVLSASLHKDVLRTTSYILSKLICADDHVSDLLMSIDSDFCCLVDLLKKGLGEAAVLLYLLRPSFSQLSPHNLITTLICTISSKNDDCADGRYPIAPKDAAIALLEQIVVGGDESDTSRFAMNVIEENGIPALLNCLDRIDGRQPIVSILLCCIRTDLNCRNVVASRIELSHVLELFHGGNESVRGTCIEFLCELVQLSRRTLSNQILQIIKDEGTFSTTHTLLVYLQMAPMEQKPATATLLLQLDLLAAPRKMSIYREEALDALVEALLRKDFPSSQIMALGMLASLSGHKIALRKSEMESWLLKSAGFDHPYSVTMRTEEMETNGAEFVELKVEERARRSWEKRIAFVLSNHEKGAIFEALEECFQSNSIDIAKSCLVVATWLVHMLYHFPDCGARDVARKSLLEKFINVLLSSMNLEEKILAALALRGFVSEPGGLEEMGNHTKSIWKTLRKLRKSCTVVRDIMKLLMKLESVDAAELWSCTEVPELDLSINGEILSLLHIRNRLISSHSDGTIKVWDTSKRVPRLVQEAREHSKAVTCLYVPRSYDKLYTGSLDKTIRVWSIKHDEIHCIQVHEVKEAVSVLAANASFACFPSQGYGVKVYSWSGTPKSINFNKQVKCMALDNDKLYCGCSGYSIQEVDLRTQTSSTFYSGAKKLLGKQTIYTIEIHNGILYTTGSSVEGTAGKVFKLSSRAVIGSLPTALDIQHATIDNEFIFTATKCGTIEVWLKDRLAKIGCIKTGSGGSASRITSVTSDGDGQKFFAGTSDGRLLVWSLD